VYCTVLGVYSSVLMCVESVLKCVGVCMRLLECVGKCWSVLQCVAVCCSVLECAASRSKWPIYGATTVIIKRSLQHKHCNTHTAMHNSHNNK